MRREQRPELLDNYSLVLSVGHDEYWSAGMRDSLEGFIARGGNCAFFAGNAVCWCVRPEDDGRALTSFKQMYVMDPVWSAFTMRITSTDLMWPYQFGSLR